MGPAEVRGKLRKELTSTQLDPLAQTDDNVFSLFDVDDDG